VASLEHKVHSRRKMPNPQVYFEENRPALDGQAARERRGTADCNEYRQVAEACCGAQSLTGVDPATPLRPLNLPTRQLANAC
jgi:hypothetical protein